MCVFVGVDLSVLYLRVCVCVCLSVLYVYANKSKCVSVPAFCLIPHNKPLTCPTDRQTDSVVEAGAAARDGGHTMSWPGGGIPLRISLHSDSWPCQGDTADMPATQQQLFWEGRELVSGSKGTSLSATSAFLICLSSSPALKSSKHYLTLLT